MLGPDVRWLVFLREFLRLVEWDGLCGGLWRRQGSVGHLMILRGGCRRPCVSVRCAR